MARHDHQIMRTLSINLTEHKYFLSTPKFISDLLYISDTLKGTDHEKRNNHLKECIAEINKLLPANVYIPIT